MGKSIRRKKGEFMWSKRFLGRRNGEEEKTDGDSKKKRERGKKEGPIDNGATE